MLALERQGRENCGARVHFAVLRRDRGDSRRWCYLHLMPVRMIVRYVLAKYTNGSFGWVDGTGQMRRESLFCTRIVNGFGIPSGSGSSSYCFRLVYGFGNVDPTCLLVLPPSQASVYINLDQIPSQFLLHSHSSNLITYTLIVTLFGAGRWMTTILSRSRYI